VLAVWALFGAIELGMISMFGCLLEDVHNGINPYDKNPSLPYLVFQQIHDNAVGAGWMGMFWGAVLGGVGGWIKTLKDRRSRRT